MKYGARNQLGAKVSEIKRGSVMCEVKLDLETPGKMASVMTIESLEELGLKPGDTVRVIVKAVNVLLVKGSDAGRDRGESHAPMATRGVTRGRERRSGSLASSLRRPARACRASRSRTDRLVEHRREVAVRACPRAPVRA